MADKDVITSEDELYGVDNGVVEILDAWEKEDPAFKDWRYATAEIYSSIISVRDQYAGDNDDLPVWCESTVSLLRLSYEWAKKEKEDNFNVADAIEAMCNPDIYNDGLEEEDDE